MQASRISAPCDYLNNILAELCSGGHVEGRWQHEVPFAWVGMTAVREFKIFKVNIPTLISHKTRNQDGAPSAIYAGNNSKVTR